MRAIDANVLVRLVVRDEPAQVRVAEEFISSGAWISHLVLAETLWVLDAVYDRSPAQIAAAVDMLLNHQQLTVQDADVVAAGLRLFRNRPFEIAREAGHVPLGSFDRDLAAHDGVERLKHRQRFGANRRVSQVASLRVRS